jgi:hypothetical protein
VREINGGGRREYCFFVENVIRSPKEGVGCYRETKTKRKKYLERKKQREERQTGGE